MNGVQLIAIRPLLGCDKKFIRILKTEKLYQFYNDYTFIYENDDISKNVIEIKYNPTIPEDLYNKAGVKINVSALVGKNGSGKSSLLELFFAAIYNIAVNLNILTVVPNDEGILEKLAPHKNLNVEIYYSLNGTIFCLTVWGEESPKFSILKFSDEKERRNFTLSGVLEEKKEYLISSFFYTIAINYSIHGLNSNQMGLWIKSLFHKNDGYQTPIVINPYRSEGNIDMNIETYLAKQRLLSNIMKPKKANKDTHRFLTDNQEVEELTFTMSENKIKYAFQISESIFVDFDTFFKTDSQQTILDELFLAFLGTTRPYNNVKFQDRLERYIVKKLIKIARTYVEYRPYFRDNLIEYLGLPGSTENRANQYSCHFNDLKSYLKLLAKDKSHLTFKLRQAINYLVNDILKEDDERRFVWQRKDEKDFLKVTVEDIANRISKFTNGDTPLIELIPPSLFDIEIHLKSSNAGKSLYSDFSSGEQQLIQSVQSIIYHASNLNSVFSGVKEGDAKLTYSYLNIILDEVELYFHPEFQRKFVKELIDALHRLNLSEIKNINLIFSTHSPFILSDIPSSNILRMKQGIPDPNSSFEPTFGANIHDLLSRDFFLENGFMGEFSKDKINEVIQFVNLVSTEKDLELMRSLETEKRDLSRMEQLQSRVTYLQERVENRNPEYHFQIIQLIGESVLKNKLESMFYNCFPDMRDNLESEIAAIERKYGVKIRKTDNDQFTTD